MSESAHSHSPLAQFEIKPYLPIKLGNYDISFTNSSLWMVLVGLGILIFLSVGGRRMQTVPGRWQMAGEASVQFVRNMIMETAGKDALKYQRFIFSVFMFILFSNLFGMIPGSFTVTSHLIVTLGLAATLFTGITLLAIVKHGPLKFLHFFLPEGTPLWMAPLIFVIELFSYLARPLSLSIRLAANMTAGHITLKIIAGLIITFGLIGGWMVFPVLMFIIAFEFAMAVIQAYIFAVLTCVYLNDALHLH